MKRFNLFNLCLHTANKSLQKTKSYLWIAVDFNYDTRPSSLNKYEILCTK